VTIRKGMPWGEPGRLPADGVIVSTDAEARDAITQARRAGRPLPVLGLVGGDLCTTLGGTGDLARLRSGAAVTFPIDVGTVVTADGHAEWFVAHAVARNRLWTRAALACNAQWIGAWNVAPRAHPDDGVLDLFDVRLPLGDLRKVRARVGAGAHLPHPGIVERRSAAGTLALEQPLPLWLDGERLPGPGVSELVVGVEPDAIRVVI
jgi:putative lipid kinase YegS-like protein